MTDQKAAGEVEVTRDHRKRAYRCIWLDEPRCNERQWIETGDASNLPLRLAATAQAIADAEARGRARACCQRDPLRIAELEADIAVVRAHLPKQNRMGMPSPNAALDRIEAALGLKG